MMVLSFWSDFFEVSEPTPNKQQFYTSRQTPSASSVYILNCLFNGFTSGSDGGALYCNTSVTYLLVESSSFFSCKTSSNIGGAIYFVNTNNGQCVLHKVCGGDCCSIIASRSDGQFAYVSVKNDASSKNYVNYSSISRCVNDIYDSFHTLWLNYGKIYCPSVNISMNKCYRFTAFYCLPFSDSNSVTGSTSYSSFTDNIASDSICISFYRSGSNTEIKCCNVLRNMQGVPSEFGIFYTSGNLIIKDSCILYNSANYIFYYTVTLSNCTIDKTTCNRNLIIQSTATKSFIHTLNHISVQNCHLGYESTATLTSNKQIQCNTCKCQQGNFVSLTSILVFNFVHPYASIW
jgi:hypothetical protein